MIFAGIADWADSDEYDVVFMCAELGVSTAGYYAWRGREPSARAVQDEALTAEIVAAYRELSGNPGGAADVGASHGGRSPDLGEAGAPVDAGR